MLHVYSFLFYLMVSSLLSLTLLAHYVSRWRPAYLQSGHADAEQKTNSKRCSVKPFDRRFVESEKPVLLVHADV